MIRRKRVEKGEGWWGNNSMDKEVDSEIENVVTFDEQSPAQEPFDYEKYIFA